MARPIEFNRSQAVNRAMVLFWQKGYQATSLTDLLSQMEISRSSFYSAFGDKRTLFVECLDLFAQRTNESIEKTCTETAALDGLQNFFDRHFSGTQAARKPDKAKPHWGCMLINTIVELAGVDQSLTKHASAHLDAMQSIFETSLKRAGASALQAKEFAALLMLFNEGIRVSSRRRIPESQLDQSIAITFGLIRRAII